MHNEKELAKHLAEELKPLIEVQKREWIGEVCEEIIPKVLHKTFIQLGIDAKNPLDMQKDFSHLRDSRKNSEDIKKKVTNELVRFSVTGIFAYLVFLWTMAKDSINHQ